MVLYTCPGGKHDILGPITAHPCAKAAVALDRAGHTYELRKVGGFKNIPFTVGSRRDEIVELTGSKAVPVLVLDDGTAIAGSGTIVRWATANPAAPAGS